jgi:hypothetical protein
MPRDCGNNWAGVCTLPRRFNGSVGWIVVSCTPRKVDVMCLYWPLMVDALLCGRLIQLMDGDLGTNAHDCGCGNDNGCDVFGHGWCEVNATGLWQC